MRKLLAIFLCLVLLVAGMNVLGLAVFATNDVMQSNKLSVSINTVDGRDEIGRNGTPSFSLRVDYAVIDRNQNPLAEGDVLSIQLPANAAEVLDLNNVVLDPNTHITATHFDKATRTISFTFGNTPGYDIQDADIGFLGITLKVTYDNKTVVLDPVKIAFNGEGAADYDLGLTFKPSTNSGGYTGYYTKISKSATGVTVNEEAKYTSVNTNKVGNVNALNGEFSFIRYAVTTNLGRTGTSVAGWDMVKPFDTFTLVDDIDAATSFPSATDVAWLNENAATYGEMTVAVQKYKTEQSQTEGYVYKSSELGVAGSVTMLNLESGAVKVSKEGTRLSVTVTADALVQANVKPAYTQSIRDGAWYTVVATYHVKVNAANLPMMYKNDVKTTLAKEGQADTVFSTSNTVQVTPIAGATYTWKMVGTALDNIEKRRADAPLLLTPEDDDTLYYSLVYVVTGSDNWAAGELGLVDHLPEQLVLDLNDFIVAEKTSANLVVAQPVQTPENGLNWLVSASNKARAADGELFMLTFKVKAEGLKPGQSIKNVARLGNSEDEAVVTRPIPLQVVKVDAHTQKPLENAVFGVYTQEGQHVSTLVSDKDGLCEALYLKAGSYVVLEESAPEGYIKSEDSFAFLITKEGALVAANILHEEGEAGFVSFVLDESDADFVHGVLTMANQKQPEEIIPEVKEVPDVKDKPEVVEEVPEVKEEVKTDKVEMVEDEVPLAAPPVAEESILTANPLTGDSDLMVVLVLALVAASAFVVFGVLRKKAKQ